MKLRSFRLIATSESSQPFQIIRGIMLTSLSWPLGVDGVAPQLERTYDFCTACDGMGEVTIGQETVTYDRLCGFILSPHRPFRVIGGENTLLLNAKVPKPTIEAELRALTGEEIGEPLESQPAMKISHEPLAGVWRLIRFIANEAERQQSLLTNMLVAERFCESLLIELLCAQPHNYSHLLHREAVPAEPNYIRRIEEYIDAHCAQPIKARDLAEMAGVGMSALYSGFNRHRGYTPLEFLKQTRLHRVRDALLTAPPETTVKEIALRCGFTRMSRFSRDYGRRFGETPSETLERAGKRQ